MLFSYRKTGFSSVRMLMPIIAAGANVNIFCSTGLNLLMMAINNYAFVHAVILLNTGADPWIRSEALNLNAIKFVLSQKRIVYQNNEGALLVLKNCNFVMPH